jgi:uncharacterized protein
MIVTAAYASILTALLIFLTARVIGTRRRVRVTIGHGENSDLLRAMRVHGNFTEYVPMALLLMALAESSAASPFILHAAGVALITGRLIHAYGVSNTNENLTLRIAGMAMTLTVLAALALTCAYLAAGKL